MEIGIFKKALCKFIIFFLLTFQVLAEKKTIAIITPSANASLTNIFGRIIEGITKSTQQFERKKLILADDNRDSLKNWLVINKPLAIIAIGDKASLFAQSVSTDAPVISSGSLLVSNASENVGVSLSIAEDALKKNCFFTCPTSKNFM